MGKLTKDDRCLIWNLRTEKHWSSRRIIKEFPNKFWSRATVDRLLKKIDSGGTTERKHGSGRPKSARTPANIELVSELICSQENRPHMHKSPREIERETGISRSSVRRIAKRDLSLTTYKRVVAQKLNENCKIKRLQRCQQLLQRFPNERSVRGIWFTDEKMFTVATPINSQNDRFYSRSSRKSECAAKNLIREREHFSPSVMVSVGVSRMGKTSVVFIEPGAKVNSLYYCEHVLSGGLLPDIRAKCLLHNWTLQQDGAPSHTARNTINYLQQENITFIEPNMWPPNSPDLNPVDYAIWGALQQRVYQWRKFNTVAQLKLAIVEEWGKLSQRFIDRSIYEWRRRLQCVVEQQGGHVEHQIALIGVLV
jgi:transposase